jgi:hypothetical protein
VSSKVMALRRVKSNRASRPRRYRRRYEPSSLLSISDHTMSTSLPYVAKGHTAGVCTYSTALRHWSP